MEQTLAVILALLPLVLGLAWSPERIPFPVYRATGLATITAVAVGWVFLHLTFESDPSLMFLAGAVIVAGACILVSLEEVEDADRVTARCLILLGLALGVLLNSGFVGRLFLCGLLVDVALLQWREPHRSFRATLSLGHLGFAILFALVYAFGGENVKLFTGLFLALTFLPLAPFHLPFVGMVKRMKGTLASFWIVAWLAVGLAQLHAIIDGLTGPLLFVLQMLALASAVYATLASLGQRQWKLFIASATVAHIALVWGLLEALPAFTRWGVPFGVALGFAMGGLCLAFAFAQERYGWQTIGNLPGLGVPMPRWGIVVTLLVSFALFLPLVPMFDGLTAMPTGEGQEVHIIPIALLLLVVWLGGGWYFLNMLHQTAFGPTRDQVPYTDLRTPELVAVSVLLTGAAYSGMIY